MNNQDLANLILFHEKMDFKINLYDYLYMTKQILYLSEHFSFIINMSHLKMCQIDMNINDKQEMLSIQN